MSEETHVARGCFAWLLLVSVLLNVVLLTLLWAAS